MNFNGFCILSVLLVCSLNEASGELCLNFDHVKDFDLAQFSGTWYAIQTTSPQSRCLVYDFKIQKKIKKVENINCVDCINCKNCVDSRYCENCEDLVGCNYCKHSKDLVDCHYLKKSKGCVGCTYGTNAIDCSSCDYVDDCKNVHNCKYPKNFTNISGLFKPKDIHKVVLVKHQFVEALKADSSSPSKLSVSSTQTDVPGKSPIVEALKADSNPSNLPGSSTQTVDVLGKLPIVEALKADLSLLSKLSISSIQTVDVLGKWPIVEALKADLILLSKLSIASIQTVDVLGKLPIVGSLKADSSLPSILFSSSTQTAEKSPFVVFTTDYQSYAGVYFCRKTANGPKHSVAILSRSQDLDKEKLDSLIEYINYYHEGVKTSTVDHKDCNHPYEAYDSNSSVQNVIGDDEKVDIHISFMTIEDKPEIP